MKDENTEALLREAAGLFYLGERQAAQCRQAK
jgi:hypothetical protein